MSNYVKANSVKAKVGDDDGGGDGGDGGGGRILPGHPGPIPNAPRDNISRKAIPSLRQRHMLAWVLKACFFIHSK